MTRLAASAKISAKSAAPRRRICCAILDKNPNENARGLACYGLAQVVKR